EIIDYSNLDDKAAELEIEKVVSEDLKRPFDLQKDSALRLKCIRKKDGTDILIFTYHHIIMDGWCGTIIFNDFFELSERLSKGTSYNAILKEIVDEREYKPDYGVYLEWLVKQDIEQAEKYWEDELEDYDGDCEIKAMRKPEPTEEQMREAFANVSREITAKLKVEAERTGITINTVAETAVGIMLQEYSGSRDVVFGKVVSGRNADITGIEDIVGLFINTIPLRVTVEKEETVAELIKKQQKKGTESTNYDYCSLADIQKKTSQGSELIKVLFVFENYTSGLKDENINNSEIILESGRDQTNYGIAVLGFEEKGKLNFKLMYDPNKYREEEVYLILDRLVKICEEMAEKPDAKVCELETVTAEEKQLILNDFNATETEYPRDKTVVELFEEQVKKTPDNIALVFRDETITYSELNKEANVIANRLRKNGIKANDCVAIISDRNIDMIVGIIGIVKSGAAYVPIDPTYPEERISYILEDSGAKAIVKNTSEGINIPDGVPVIDLALKENNEGSAENPEIVNKPEDLLYCIYTSGTTGKPKGVMQLHRTIVNLICDEYRTMGSDTFEKTLFATNCGFDVSVQEYFSTLLCGGTGYIITLEEKQDAESCMRIVDENKITTMFATPSYFDMLSIEETDRLASNIKNAILAGEAFKISNVLLECEKASDMRMHNHYGPTESHVVTTKQATVAELRDSRTLDLGKPVANNQIYIL
ncbi:MAG: AMP-binding protein, partial [Oscillospiraceae bacterium]|nr:AMP-binding protein [Oscillospiraceae bacterium]